VAGEAADQRHASFLEKALNSKAQWRCVLQFIPGVENAPPTVRVSLSEAFGASAPCMRVAPPSWPDLLVLPADLRTKDPARLAQVADIRR
jgi:hypothetical protein